jgi:hypothetical protein
MSEGTRMTNPINMDDLVQRVQSAATGGVIHAEGTLIGKTPTRPADEVLFDVCGRKRSPATLRHFRLGMKPPNYGKRYPATPPTEEEVLAVLGACRRNPNGRRCYALTVLLWRSGLRVSEGLALEKHDLRPAEGTVFVRCGKGGKARMSGMDEWAFEQVMEYADWRYGRYPGTWLFPSCRDRRRASRGRRARTARSSATWPPRPACSVVWRRISFVTLTPASSRARACPSSTSRGSSATRTSRRRPPTSAGSAWARRSRSSTRGARPESWCPRELAAADHRRRRDG